MSRQPRINVDSWVGPMTNQFPQDPGGVQLMSQMGTIIFKGTPEGGSDPDWKSKLASYAVTNSVELGNICGAQVQAARDAGYTVSDNGDITPPTVTAVPTTPPSLKANSIPLPWFTSPSGQVNVTVAEEDGRYSCSAGSGNVVVALSTDPTFPNDDSKTQSGSGATSGLPVMAGASFYFKQMSDGVQDMRASGS